MGFQAELAWSAHPQKLRLALVNLDPNSEGPQQLAQLDMQSYAQVPQEDRAS